MLRAARGSDPAGGGPQGTRRAPARVGPARLTPRTRSKINRPIPWASPWTIVAAGAVVRLIALVRAYEPLDKWRGDPRTYADILEALLDGRVDPAMWVWPPGLPAAAIPFRFIIGTGPALNLVAWVAGVAALAILVATGRRLGSMIPFGAAAVVLAFFPESVLAAARPLPGSLAILGSLGAVIGLEAAVRSGRLRWAAVAGLAGAIATLSRPETAISMPLYALIALLARGRPWKAVLVCTAVFTLAVAPYAIAFRNASGVWGLSIKPHINILKIQVYGEGGDFADRRVRWDAYQEQFSDSEGRLDPRPVVEAANPAEYFLGPDAARTTVSNFAYAFRRDPFWVNLLWIVGIGGLILGKRPLRERAYGLVFALPVVSAAMLFPPVERYALITVPAFGYGVGCAIDRIRHRLGPASRPIWAVAVGLLAILGTIEATRQLATYQWQGRYGEFLAERARGNLGEAEAILREAISVDRSNPAPHEALGALLRDRGDLPGALAAFVASVECGGNPVPLAAMYARAGRMNEAKDLIAPLRASPPDSPDYWSVVGHLAMMSRDWSRADESFAKSESFGGPGDVLSLNRGHALVRAGRPGEASDMFRRAAESANPAVRREAADALADLETGRATVGGP